MRDVQLLGWWGYVAWECEILQDVDGVSAEIARYLSRRVLQPA
jgi:hypothetical protein